MACLKSCDCFCVQNMSKCGCVYNILRFKFESILYVCFDDDRHTPGTRDT
jgi:hypothetical protein